MSERSQTHFAATVDIRLGTHVHMQKLVTNHIAVIEVYPDKHVRVALVTSKLANLCGN